MCGYKVLWGKSVLLYVFFDSKLLFLIISSAVDDDAFLGVVANHVAVLLQHVACEGLYIKHFFFFLLMIYKGRYIRYFSLNHSSSNMSWMSVMLTIFLNGLVSLLRSPPFRQIRPLGNEFC